MMKHLNTKSLLAGIGALLFATALQAQQNAPVLNAQLKRQMVEATTPQQQIYLKNLMPGHAYSLLVPGGEACLAQCWPDISALTPDVPGLKYDPIRHMLAFEAIAPLMGFQLNYPCEWDVANPPRHFVSIIDRSEKKKNIGGTPESVLEVSGGTAEDLVKEVFIGGNCFDVSNVKFTGVGAQIGSFQNGLTNIGFSSGMILATGDISVAPGPNDSDGASGGYGIGVQDSDLMTIATGNLFDRASVEFDFTPTQSPLVFEYVFASEEYCEYINTQFADAFGFFISGPGINGTQNLAVVPGSLIPININTVNHEVNSGYYVHNTPASGNNCGVVPPATGPATQEIQYDGFTRKMVALAQVLPCSTYHLKLKIADVGDGIWDSAVFLKAGSFDGGGNADIEWLVDGEPNIDEITEGCGTAELHIKRVGGNISLPVPVSYSISGSAVNGTDYGPLSASYVIPGGTNEITVAVPIAVDMIQEGAETVSLTLLNACSCLHPQKTLTIRDYTPMQAKGDTVTICGPSGVATISVNVTGGVPPYQYKWSTGSTDQEATVFVSNPTNYTVTVTDACGKTSTANARAIPLPGSSVKFLPPAPQICPGLSVQLMVDFDGPAPYQFTYQVNGVPQVPIDGITNDPYKLIVNQPGLYQPSGMIDGNGCPGTASGALLVINSTLAVSGVVTDASCVNVANGAINTTVTGGQGPYQYVWSGPSVIGNVPDPNHILPGNYTLTLTDAAGCEVVKAFTIGGPPCNWQVTPTGRNHTMILPVDLVSDLDMPLLSGDWIGAFYDSSGTLKCAGYGVWTGANVSFPVFGNDAVAPAKNGFNTGEIFKIKVRRNSQNQDFDADATYAPPGTLGLVTHTNAFADDGISMIKSISTAFRIPLAQGWNMNSSYMAPTNPEMLHVFTPIAPSIDIVKDDHGLSMIPAFQINSIGNWDVREGYQIKANQKDTLAIVGQKVVPENTPIPLTPGWQMIGYLRDKPQNIDTVFKLIKGQILLVKDNFGKSYSPQFNINTIGDMKPGQGYKVNAMSNVVLQYRPNFKSDAPDRAEISEYPAHFQLDRSLNTGNNATLILPVAEAESVFQPGDEIGIFSAAGALCGSALYRQENLAITVWGDDPTTNTVKEGLLPGESYQFKCWKAGEQKEIPLNLRIQSGQTTYRPDAVELLDRLETGAAEEANTLVPTLQVFPNPASESLNILIGSRRSGKAEIKLIASDGSIVWKEEQLTYSVGETLKTLPVSKLASGLYCLSIKLEDVVLNRLIGIKTE